jgi:MFS family permease
VPLSWRHGASVCEVGAASGIYPDVWDAGQVFIGHWSDRVGRKPLIVAGMLLQSGALATLAISDGRFAIGAAAAVLLGVGTALVYPTLIAASRTPSHRSRGRRPWVCITLARPRLRLGRPNRQHGS